RAKKLDDHWPGVKLAILGEIYHAAAAASELLFDEVAPNEQLPFVVPRGIGGEGAGGTIKQGLATGRGEESGVQGSLLGQQAEDFGADLGIVGTCAPDKFGALVFRLFERGVEQRFDALPLLGGHASRPRNSARSHARAISQSRFTVLGETP